MKKFTIEQKAKAYDEAVERAKKLQETCDSQAVVGWCEYILPEIRESEDEKNRREIIGFIRNAYWTSNRDRFNELVVWLGKQGEQNPYSGVSFKYNGHTFGMCARDGGAEILMDGVILKHLFHQINLLFILLTLLLFLKPKISM